MDKEALDYLGKQVESLEDAMVKTLSRLVELKGVGPKSGGEGELEKVEYLEGLARDLGFENIERFDSPDPDVPSGIRPNAVVTVPGGRSEGEGVIWVVAHTDIVPAGDLDEWDTPPFEPTLKDGKLFGRGTEDNGQDLVAALYALKAIADLGMKPERTVKLAMVADEETGSVHGIQYLIKQDLFAKEDLIIVPDYGESDGSVMEVSEKSILWMKVTTEGKMVHASMPQLGVNANRAAMKFILALDELLHEKYTKMDDLFLPPGSTFEPTKRETNVSNVNTIPGKDVSYFDCRILPQYDYLKVLEDAKVLAEKVSAETGATITVEVDQKDQAAPPTPADAPVVTRLGRAIEKMAGITAKPTGIGGGTCGAFFRRKGLDAVIWATLEEMGHQPNEYSRVSNMVQDAKVLAGFYMDV